MTTIEPEPSARPSTRRKAVLFCAECGHESGVAGDWVLHESSGGIAYECPDCGTTITTRSRPRPVCC